MPRDDYDDDDRPRPRDDDDYDDRPRSRRPEKQVSVLGIIALIMGVGALIVSIIPCIGAFAAIPGLLAVVLGSIGLVVAKKSNGRQGTGLRTLLPIRQPPPSAVVQTWQGSAPASGLFKSQITNH